MFTLAAARVFRRAVMGPTWTSRELKQIHPQNSKREFRSTYLRSLTSTCLTWTPSKHFGLSPRGSTIYICNASLAQLIPEFVCMSILRINFCLLGASFAALRCELGSRFACRLPLHSTAGAELQNDLMHMCALLSLPGGSYAPPHRR